MSRWRERYALATSEADVVVGPVLDGLAPTIEAVRRDYERDESLIRRRLLRHTPQANALGWAALAYPSADGPVQVMAPEGCEELLLAVAASGRRLNRTL
jgi:Asp-tRNA(Asn)/Glu-tRNA(Gln) amidotransferase A subunit family amidase